MGTCKLATVASQLRGSSSSAVVNCLCEDLNDLQSYLHIERPIERELRKILESIAARSAGLVLVCGNVGDGKSHLIARMKRVRPELMRDFTIHNDATESTSPEQDCIDELRVRLAAFADDKIGHCAERVVIAINLGTLNNFVVAAQGEFSRLHKFVEGGKILSTATEGTLPRETSDGVFQFVSFCDHHLFSLTESGPSSPIIDLALSRIVSSNYDNPFFEAYNGGCCANRTCPIRLNFELLQEKTVRARIRDLLIQSIIAEHQVISMRALYDFIHDLLIPPMALEGSARRGSKLAELFPISLFEHPDRSSMYLHLSGFDPALRRNQSLDEQVIRMSTVGLANTQWEGLKCSAQVHERLKHHLASLPNSKSASSYVASYVRLSYFLSPAIPELRDDDFDRFMRLLYGWYARNKVSIKAAYKMLNCAIMNWNGQSLGGELMIDSDAPQLEYRLSQEVSLKPKLPESHCISSEQIACFAYTIPLEYQLRADDDTATAFMDFRLFKIARKIQQGYQVNHLDRHDFISFTKFVEKISTSGGCDQRVRITDSASGHSVALTKDAFGDYVLEELGL